MKTKENRAITLVALIITIVVLIILATVAINLSLGNNGIFNRAKSAKEQYSNAQYDEEDKLAKSINKIEEYVSGNRDDKILELENKIMQMENKLNYIKLTGAKTASTANTWEKLYDYPEGFNQQNTFVVSGKVGDYNLNYSDDNFAMICFVNDGIYAKVSNYFRSYDVELIIMKME